MGVLMVGRGLRSIFTREGVIGSKRNEQNDGVLTYRIQFCP